MHRLRLKTVLAAKIFPMGVLGAFSWTSFAGLAISQQISSQCLYILLDNDKKHFSIQQLVGTLTDKVQLPTHNTEEIGPERLAEFVKVQEG